MDAHQLLGKNIQRLRGEKKISQKNLAAKLNCTVQHLSSLENGRGKGSIDFAECVAAALDVRVSELFLTEEEIERHRQFLKHEEDFYSIVNESVNFFSKRKNS